MTTNEPRKSWRRWVLAVVPIAGVGLYLGTRPGPVEQEAAPVVIDIDQVDRDSAETPITRASSITEVLDLASRSREAMATRLHDYTARFIQQEQDSSGKLGEVFEYQIKIQTRMRNESLDAPKRIYMNFVRPEANAGREVIWGKDLYKGKMAVHEASLPFSLTTVWLDPTGMLAMAGQKYPIYEMGLVRLVEQLIERGERDRDNPETKVTVTRDHEFDGRLCELIQVVHARPSDEEDDFALAEIVYDPEQLLILSYRSFDWVDGKLSETPPLIESYQYLDLKTNVGLSDEDFDVKNEEYSFP
ncbi:MAG: DUF1571 domain-containing protein [Planctomycetota bacterium]